MVLFVFSSDLTVAISSDPKICILCVLHIGAGGRRGEGVYVGTLQGTVYADATAYLAYILFPAFWRQGYAREGCRRILELLFEDYQVHNIVAEIDTRNVASIKLIESLGFQRVATKLNADFFKGSTSHEYRYKLLSPHEAV